MTIEDLRELDQEFEIPHQLQRLGLGKRTLHPDAHIDISTLKELSHAEVVGNPANWMGNNLNNNQDLLPEVIPAQMKQVLLTLEQMNPGVCEHHINKMTKLANEGDPLAEDDRREYQKHEMALMQIVKDYVKELLFEYLPERSVQWLALRGAKAFEKTFEDLAPASIEQEVKRIRLEGNEFAIGVGELKGKNIPHPENIDAIITPDDCLSTGMSQEMVIKEIFRNGYRPKVIVVPVTIATTDGYAYLQEIQERLMREYNHPFDLHIVCATKCESVSGNMYLQTSDSKMLVGDMGDWNQPTAPFES